MIHRTVIYYSPDGNSFDFTSYPGALSDFDGIYIPSVSAQSQRSPFQDGSDYIGTTLQERELSFTCGYVKSFDLSEIQAWRRSLQSVCNPKTNDRLGLGYVDFTENGVLRRFHCRVEAVSMAPISRRKAGNDAVVTFVCHDPFAYADTTEYSSASAIQAQPIPSVLNSSILGLVNTNGTIITVGGDCPTPVVITIDGPCVVPKIELGTGEFIRYNANVNSGETLVIDTKEKTVKKNGVTSIQYLDIGSTFFELEVGDNNVYCTENGIPTAAIFEVAFNEKYVGV